MTVKFYSESDYDEIKSWYETRGLPAPQKEELPKVGVVVPGIAAGFLYQTDSTVAFLGDYIANPNSEKKERDLALDFITATLLTSARSKGCKVVNAFTYIPAIIERAKAHGFVIDEDHNFKALVRAK